MNKKLLGFFFFVVLAIVFFLAYPFNKKENLPPPIFVEVTATSTSEKPKKIIGLAKRRPSKKFKIKDNSSPCRDVFSLLSDISFAEIKENAEDIIDLATKKDCQKEIKNTLIDKMRENCLQSVELLSSKKCNTFLINLRAWAIDSSFPDDNLAGLDDTVLINKFLWKFTNNPTFKLEKLNNSLLMINEILSRRPDFYSAHKAKLIHLFLKEIQHKENVDEELNSTLDALNSLGSDQQVAEFPIVLNLNKEKIDEKKTKFHIDNYLKNNPNSSRGYYYMAALEWKKHKNLSGVKELLKTALKKNPNDPFVKNTLSSIKKSKGKKPTFYFSIDFNFQDL